MNLKKALVLTSALLLVACSSKDDMTTEMKSFQHDLEENAASKIYFETDLPRPGKLCLNDDQTRSAKTVAEWLHHDKHLKVALILEGHCDERGTSEYNMALGERRAMAVKNGILGEYKRMFNKELDASRVDIVSFGKENNPVPNKEGLSYAEYLAKNRVVLVKVKEVH
jgi:peptidoglycan-associated lipoprotein